MMMTPLEKWIGSKVGAVTGRPGRRVIEAYQLARLGRTLDWVMARSPFYKRLLSDFRDYRINSLSDLAALPFTTARDVAENSLEMLCVSQDDIARVVTLDTSGTTSRPKRLYFTEEDLDLTVDFFHWGMSTLVEPGQRVLILMPGERPGSVGDLLVRGLRRMEVTGIVHGPVMDPLKALDDIVEHKPDCLVGIPAQVLALARHPEADRIPSGRIKSVLLSTDYVPAATIRELGRTWGCPVFNHYGMTEMGLGGAVECRALAGYHLREADLLFEIIDPDSGRVLPRGEWGEAVFTTLTRSGMPLIRYRTGDLTRFMVEPCPCGTVLERMDKVRGRVEGMILLKSGGRLGIADLDESIFSLPGVFNYLAEIKDGHGPDRLCVTLGATAEAEQAALAAIGRKISEIPVVQKALESGALVLDPVILNPETWLTSGVAKRKILDSRTGPTAC